VLLPGLPLQWWNKRALVDVVNNLGRFIVVDEVALTTPDKRICKVLVEIDIHAGLPETIELEWRGLLRCQRIDFMGIPFRCSWCRQTGHLRRDCLGGFVEEESFDSSLLRRPTCEDPLEVTLGDWNGFNTGAEFISSGGTVSNFSGKLRTLCPSLFFSLSSWECDTLDKIVGAGGGCNQDSEPLESPDMDSLLAFISSCFSSGQ
jgi:hypothetical protein